MSKYKSIVTDLGKQKILDAVKSGKKVNIIHFAVGDGNGLPYRPTSDMTALKNEVWRDNVASYEIMEESPNVIRVTALIPSDAGGFTIREMALFDKENDMIAIANTADMVKVRAIDGMQTEINTAMRIAVTNTDEVTFEIDSNLVYVSQKDLQNHNNSESAHTKLFSTKANANLDNVTREAILEKVGNITETLEELIGLVNDTGGTAQDGTVMAKLNKLLTDWTTTRAGYIDTINTNAARLTSTRATKIDNIGTTGDTGGTTTAGTVMGKLNALLNTMASGVGIKSVQKGTARCTAGSSTASLNAVTISTIDVSKSFVISELIVNNNYLNSNYNMVAILNANSVSFSGYIAPGFSVYWQVVEFY